MASVAPYDGTTETVAGADVCPPAAALTVAVPGDAISEAGTVAVSMVVPRTDVWRAEPFQESTVPGDAPLALANNTKLVPPTITDAGLRLLICGGPLVD